jgi:hypothetical protein
MKSTLAVLLLTTTTTKATPIRDFDYYREKRAEADYRRVTGNLAQEIGVASYILGIRIPLEAAHRVILGGCLKSTTFKFFLHREPRFRILRIIPVFADARHDCVIVDKFDDGDRNFEENRQQ